MSFYDELARWPHETLDALIASSTADDVQRALTATRPGPADLAALLSPAAMPYLEDMAQRAHELTVRHFGRTIQLFTPLYLANHCTNQCRYCGFNARNHIRRDQLDAERIMGEGRAIANTGLRQLLLLTGDAPRISTVSYIAEAAHRLRPLFPSLGVEVYAMQVEEYAELVAGGVESLTMFQETYNPGLYAWLHPAGPKRDFRFRLDAPERGCLGGMRSVGLGALLGLDDWRRDAFYTALHGAWLQRYYPATEVSFSVPRMRPHTGSFEPQHPVSDHELVQILTAYRIFLPMAGITVSSREAAVFRDNLIPLGVTRMSAGVSTAVGGHAAGGDGNVASAEASALAARMDAASDDATGYSPAHAAAEGLRQGDDAGPSQFDISDDRSVEEMVSAITARGYQPVFKDWEPPQDNVYACGASGHADGTVRCEAR
ncbi:2-iminoacetate synthase ThiH [Nitratidesulfovibrio vulgaris]|uniref:2-iminoacetate synthase ThiH n=1 Tax=Nitratidesulfovibrio vulgaris TaxID=881 RepID=UPI002300BBCE|nr:2-iminoacetate synthase ThiH [Nitratidesulfovibrio vulgaris]WCB45617.1 2-iminoacetate synthase ThiH [Nitratidesulfovibrio vulgaris]